MVDRVKVQDPPDAAEDVPLYRSYTVYVVSFVFRALRTVLIASYGNLNTRERFSGSRIVVLSRVIVEPVTVTDESTVIEF